MMMMTTTDTPMAMTPSSDVTQRLRNLTIQVPMAMETTSTPVPMSIEFKEPATKKKNKKSKKSEEKKHDVHPEIANIESQAMFVANQIKVLKERLDQHRGRLKQILVESGQNKLFGLKISVYQTTKVIQPPSATKRQIQRVPERTERDTAAYMNRFLVQKKCIEPDIDIGTPCMAWIQKQWALDHPITKMEEEPDATPLVPIVKRTLVIRGLGK